MKRGSAFIAVGRRVAAIAVLMLSASTAGAQTAYVAGALGADIARAGSSDNTPQAGTGEALSFSLRVGAPVASRFGVELDFTRPSEIERDESPDVRILSTAISSLPPSLVTALNGAVGTLAPTFIYPEISYRVRTARRTTTLTAAASARSELGGRVSLVYLAGVAFARTDRRYDYTFTIRPLYLDASIFPLPSSAKVVTYDAGPMAGIEARIGLTDHVHLVPGTRLLAIEGAWIVRPAIALGWAF